MYSIDWFKDKRVTVMGLGTLGGGLGVAKWLVRHGAAVTVTDLRDEHALAAPMAELGRTVLRERRRRGEEAVRDVRYVLGRHDDALFADADMVIRNPAVPREHPLLALAAGRGVPVESDISLFFHLCPFPIAAVTGTKGKTTTTSLLAAICRAHDPRTVLGGNIRISPMDALDRLVALAGRRSPVAPPIVLELSSWQLETLEPHRLSPHVAVVTNVLEDHLNRYSGMEEYAKAKEIIVAYQGPEDAAVMNADDPRVRAMRSGQGRRLWFSTRRRASGGYVAAGKVMVREGRRDEAVIRLKDVALLGAHNAGNIAAAVIAARAMGVPAATIRKAVRAFKGVPGRLEVLAKKRGILFVNDTTATTPDAAMAALATFPKRRIVLLGGGADKNLRFGTWAKAVKARVKHLVLFEGTATPKMEAALSEARVDVPMSVVGSMREAMAEAMRHARSGDVVLLSPGCASFGVFKNEFDRGDQFAEAVRKVR